MPLLIESKPLTNERIIQELRQLRTHSAVDSSHFAVAALLEIPLANQQYAYVGGVNVENDYHNRLGIHAEQNAIAAAKTLLKGDLMITKVWVMGAPDHLSPASEHPLTTHFVKPCGHCRQLLLSHAKPDAEIFSVNLKGEVSASDELSYLLPQAFSERDLDLSTDNVGKKSCIQLPVCDLLNNTSPLETDVIYNYLKQLSPHIIHPDYKTSATTACIVKTNQQDYIPGVLVQDVAFLTTDAIFSALGLGVTKLGTNNFAITELHLFSDSAQQATLSNSEKDAIIKYTQGDFKITTYN